MRGPGSESCWRCCRRLFRPSLDARLFMVCFSSFPSHLFCWIVYKEMQWGSDVEMIASLTTHSDGPLGTRWPYQHHEIGDSSTSLSTRPETLALHSDSKPTSAALWRATIPVYFWTTKGRNTDCVDGCFTISSGLWITS